MEDTDTEIVYTDEEIDIAFECLLGMPARQADIAVIKTLGSPTPQSVAEYIWDHWMGEPEETSVDQLETCLLENDWIILDDGTEIVQRDDGTYLLQALIVPSAQEGAWDVSPTPVVLSIGTVDALLAEARGLARRKRREAASDRGPNQQL